MPRVIPALSHAALVLLAAAACGTPAADARPTRPADPSGSASTASAAAAPAAANASAAGECPVPVCRYEGTAWAEDLIGDELVDRGEARVSWIFSHMDGREAVYRASGQVTAAWRTDRCQIALQPAARVFTPDSAGTGHTELKVDFTTRPIRYTAHGSTEWPGTQTWACAGDTPFTQEGVSTTWLRAEEIPADDPGMLQNTHEFETGRSGWEFRTAS